MQNFRIRRQQSIKEEKDSVEYNLYIIDQAFSEDQCTIQHRYPCKKKFTKYNIKIDF